MATDLYFMGGDDNSQYKSKLLNYLQIIYNQPTPADNWINTNYTLLPDSYVAKIDDKSVQATISNQLDAKVDQTMSPTKNTCIRFNFTVRYTLNLRITIMGQLAFFQQEKVYM